MMFRCPQQVTSPILSLARRPLTPGLRGASARLQSSPVRQKPWRNAVLPKMRSLSGTQSHNCRRVRAGNALNPPRSGRRLTYARSRLYSIVPLQRDWFRRHDGRDGVLVDKLEICTPLLHDRTLVALRQGSPELNSFSKRRVRGASLSRVIEECALQRLHQLTAIPS